MKDRLLVWIMRALHPDAVHALWAYGSLLLAFLLLLAVLAGASTVYWREWPVY